MLPFYHSNDHQDKQSTCKAQTLPHSEFVAFGVDPVLPCKKLEKKTFTFPKRPSEFRMDPFLEFKKAENRANINDVRKSHRDKVQVLPAMPKGPTLKHYSQASWSASRSVTRRVCWSFFCCSCSTCARRAPRCSWFSTSRLLKLDIRISMSSTFGSPTSVTRSPA